MYVHLEGKSMTKPMTEAELVAITTRAQQGAWALPETLRADAQALLAEVQRARGAATRQPQVRRCSKEGTVWLDTRSRLHLDVRGLLRLAELKLREEFVSGAGTEEKVLEAIAEFVKGVMLGLFPQAPLMAVALTALEKAAAKAMQEATQAGEWPFTALVPMDASHGVDIGITND